MYNALVSLYKEDVVKKNVPDSLLSKTIDKDWNYEVESIALEVYDFFQIPKKNRFFYLKVFKALIDENIAMQQRKKQQKIAARQQAWNRKRKVATAQTKQKGGAAKISKN